MLYTPEVHSTVYICISIAQSEYFKIVKHIFFPHHLVIHRKVHIYIHTDTQHIYIHTRWEKEQINKRARKRFDAREKNNNPMDWRWGNFGYGEKYRGQHSFNWDKVLYHHRSFWTPTKWCASDLVQCYQSQIIIGYTCDTFSTWRSKAHQMLLRIQRHQHTYLHTFTREQMYQNKKKTKWEMKQAPKTQYTS